MSSLKTNFYKMHKWEEDDNVSRVEFNDNFELIDGKIKSVEDETNDFKNKTQSLKNNINTQESKLNDIDNDLKQHIRTDQTQKLKSDINNLKSEIARSKNKLELVESKVEDVLENSNEEGFIKHNGNVMVSVIKGESYFTIKPNQKINKPVKNIKIILTSANRLMSVKLESISKGSWFVTGPYHIGKINVFGSWCSDDTLILGRDDNDNGICRGCRTLNSETQGVFGTNNVATNIMIKNIEIDDRTNDIRVHYKSPYSNKMLNFKIDLIAR